MESMLHFYCGAKGVAEALDGFVSENGLRRSVVADHICYKCDSSESYEHMRRLLEPNSTFMYQSFISDRRIAYFKLQTPVSSSTAGNVYFIELSDQKPDGSQKDKFDHVEIYPSEGIEYDYLVGHLKQRSNTVEYVDRPHHSTHDVILPGGFIIRLTSEPLIEKIRREEFR